MKRVFYIGLLLSVCALATAQTAIQLPTGETIAKAAKAARLKPKASTTSEKYGMKVRVTPTDLSNVKSSEDLAMGQVIAVVDVKGVPDLPNGRYNLFVVKLNDGWQEFLESGGRSLGSPSPSKSVQQSPASAGRPDLWSNWRPAVVGVCPIALAAAMDSA